MKKFARNQLARQLIDLPNCGGRSLKASRISSSRACVDSMKTEQAEPLHEPIGALSRFLTPEFMRVDANTRFLVPKTFKPP